MAEGEYDKRKNEPYRRIIAAPMPRSLDRRVKITDEDKDLIKSMYRHGDAINAIAREFKDKCSKRTIQFILFPERYDKAKEQFKERRKDGRYKPGKVEWAATQKDHRAYKKKVLTSQQQDDMPKKQE